MTQQDVTINDGNKNDFALLYGLLEHDLDVMMAAKATVRNLYAEVKLIV